ncbi:MAG TPA: TetR/AcrR family transcriptional regulator [Myxococcota bacterium]|nr:TetR/AcrR family transcriptional regulator [Myxococcota bacterium]
MAQGDVTTKDRILAAAESLFAERGFDGAAIRDIAARSGINGASLYNHFPSKQALYEAVLERGIRPLLGELIQAAATPDPSPAAGDRIIGALMAHLERTPLLPRLVQHEAVRGGEHLVRLARRWIRPLFDQGLAALKASPDARRWSEDELPLLIAAYLHLVFGHFAMAPLLAEVLDEDPLAAASLARQTRFLRKLSQLLVGPAVPHPEGSPHEAQ